MHHDTSPQGETSVSVIGAGIAGVWQALAFARAGFAVTLHDRSRADAMNAATSHWAGGMLAPWCEAEATEPVVMRLGVKSLELWRDALPDTPFNGSLVVSHPRDRADFERFARMTTSHRRVDAAEISGIEPALAGQFREGLLFTGEGHVEPRLVLPQLLGLIETSGGRIAFGSDIGDADNDNGLVIDCRGFGARASQPQLRGVKGEMIVVESGEIKLSRPVRLIHPRWPLYIIPRADNRFMIGATSIENESDGVTVRSALELLSAAYAVHPAFAEARIIEIGSALRPAYPDNLPRIDIARQRISVNGLYRHGFLLAPALAELTLNYVARGVIDNEVMRCA